MKPLAVELLHIAVGEESVLAEAAALGLKKLRREHHQRAECLEQGERESPAEFELEILKLRALLKDPAGDHGRHESALGHEKGSERSRTRAQVSEAARTVRIGGRQIEVQAGHEKQEAAPEDEPVPPAEQDELEDRQADPGVPEARARQCPHGARRPHRPDIPLEGESFGPERVPPGEDECEKTKLQDD